METTLSEPQYQLLLSLVDSTRKQGNKIFDKKDNCFQFKTIRELEAISGESKSSLGRLFKALSDNDLTRKVTDVFGTQRIMLSPFYLSCTHNPFELLFKKAMYAQGSHIKALAWGKDCRRDGVLYNWDNHLKEFDEESGELFNGDVIRHITPEFTKRWVKSFDDFNPRKSSTSLYLSPVTHLPLSLTQEAA